MKFRNLNENILSGIGKMFKEDIDVAREFPLLFPQDNPDIVKAFANWRRNKDGTYTCNGDLDLRNIIKYNLVNKRRNQMVVPLRAVHGKVKLDGVDLGGEARKVNFTSIDWNNLIKVSEFCKSRDIPLTALNLADFDKVSGITGEKARFAKNFIHLNEDGEPEQDPKDIPLNQDKKCCGHCDGTCGGKDEPLNQGKKCCGGKCKKSLKQRVIEIDQEIKAKELEESVLTKLKSLSQRLQRINESLEDRNKREVRELLNEANLMGVTVNVPLNKFVKVYIGEYQSAKKLESAKNVSQIFKSTKELDPAVVEDILSDDRVRQNDAFNAIKKMVGEKLANTRLAIEFLDIEGIDGESVKAAQEAVINAAKHYTECFEKVKMLEKENDEMKELIKEGMVKQIVGTAGSAMGCVLAMHDCFIRMDKARVKSVLDESKYKKNIVSNLNKIFKDFEISVNLADDTMLQLLELIKAADKNAVKISSTDTIPQDALPNIKYSQFSEGIGSDIINKVKEFSKSIVAAVKSCYEKVRDYVAGLFDSTKDFYTNYEEFVSMVGKSIDESDNK